MAVKFVITEEEKPYHVSGTDFMASFSATVSEAQQGRGGGGQPPRVIAHENVELLVAGVVADARETDDNGIALFQNVAISSPSRVVAVRARAEINGVIHTSAPKNIALPQPEKKTTKEKKFLVEIRGPYDVDKKFDILMRTQSSKEEITILSRNPVNIVPADADNNSSGVKFRFLTDNKSEVFIAIDFLSEETMLTIRHTPSGETQKRMLIK
jgi:hypothetical protein